MFVSRRAWSVTPVASWDALYLASCRGIYDLHNALIEASCCEAVVANSLPGTPASS
jgi:hypothetical protein